MPVNFPYGAIQFLIGLRSYNYKMHYANVVIKNNKIAYELWHDCSIRSYGIILSIMGYFLSTAQKP